VAARFLDALATDDAREAFRAWRRCRREHVPPRLDAFAPFGLPRTVVPHLLLYRLTVDGALLCTLAGDEVVNLYGFNPVGRTILELAPTPEGERRFAQLTQVIASGLPVWYEGGVMIAGKEHLDLGRLALPVARPDGALGVLLIGFYLSRGFAGKRLGAVIARPNSPIAFERAILTWCTADDLVDEG
jgi:hypothetical protein